uniref:Bifunctional purine biosynthesis protein ade10 n=1 Tax=Cryptococcus bacillisporus CA1280 TaxID=1296109 RepID=A0A0D0TNH9_CRYGA|nr:bifunctional purine biosynthesis protein ade10 [Cryptococcus bacillisporus CA1280]
MFPTSPRPLRCWAAESRPFTPLSTVVSFLETFLLILPTLLPI